MVQLLAHPWTRQLAFFFRSGRPVRHWSIDELDLIAHEACSIPDAFELTGHDHEPASE
jgi:hypothetical protein